MIINALINNIPILPTFSSRLSNTHLESFTSSDEESEPNIQSTSKIDDDTHIWRYQLVRSLISTYDQIYGIIRKYDEVSVNSEDNVQQGKIKLELIKMALLLNPMDLLVSRHRNHTFSDVNVEGLDDSEQLSIEEHTYQQEKLFRWKINRILGKLTRGMRRLRLVLFNSSYRTQLASYIPVYRKRIERSRIVLRMHLYEYNLLNPILSKEKREDGFSEHPKSIEQILTEITARDPLLNQRIEDYRILLNSNESQDREHEFLSSPVISIRRQSHPSLIQMEDHLSPIEPLESSDLQHEADGFFDWNPIV